MSTQPQITKSRRFSLAPLIGALVPWRKRVAMTHHVRLLTEPIQFEEESLPSFVRVAMLAACALVILFIAWASLLQIDEVASTNGQVAPSSAIQVVQHLEGGIVAEILVSEGQLVPANTVLIKLVTTQAQADLQETTARYVGLLLRKERLNSIVEHRSPNFEAIGADFPQLIGEQRRLMDSQIDQQRSAIAVLSAQIAQRTQEIQQLTEQLSTAREQERITAEQADIRRRGVEAGVVSKQVYLDTSRAYSTARGEAERLRQQISVTQQNLSEAQRRRENLGDLQVQDAVNELGTVGAELEQVKGLLDKQHDRVNRLDIRSPVAGLVQDLKVHSVGEVLPAGGIVGRVVPVDDILDAEVRIAPGDVGHVHVGQHVRIKVSSFEYVRYGTINGTIDKISPTTFTDEGGKPYYKSTVKLDRAYMGPGVGVNPIMPGMVVQADIVTGNRTLIEYLLKPIYLALQDSFHER
jgi:adhesin transport system membrane fusion protein